MSTEETKPDNGEVIDNQSSPGESTSTPQTTNQQATGAQATAPAPSQPSAPPTASAFNKPVDDDDEDDEPRSDFGAMLDQFEQEQAGFQEGEVMRGTVVGITERGVVIDFGYKSEGIVNQAEFTENGELTVKPGDEVDVRPAEFVTGRADQVEFVAG
jgi:small subunit ribosomal protein S1